MTSAQPPQPPQHSRHSCPAHLSVLAFQLQCSWNAECRARGLRDDLVRRDRSPPQRILCPEGAHTKPRPAEPPPPRTTRARRLAGVFTPVRHDLDLRKPHVHCIDHLRLSLGKWEGSSGQGMCSVHTAACAHGPLSCLPTLPPYPLFPHLGLRRRTAPCSRPSME